MIRHRYDTHDSTAFARILPALVYVVALAAASSLNAQRPTAIGSANWPQFRGPTGDGVVPDSESIPIKWDDQTNLDWKVDLPGAGSSTPVIWGDNLYLTCYSGTVVDPVESRRNDPLRQIFLCLDKRTGETRWKVDLDVVQPSEKLRKEGSGGLREHGFASGSAFANADGVFVYFGATGLFHYSHDGTEVWRKSLGTTTHPWAYGTSPVIHDGKLYINATLEGTSAQILDTKTGEKTWQINEAKTFVPALVVQVGGKTIFCEMHNGKMIGYEATTGERGWKCPYFGDAHVPLLHDNVIYQRHVAARITADGAELLWNTPGIGKVTGPVYHDGRLYFLADGKFFCRDAATGEYVYRERVQSRASCYASAMRHGDHIYYVTRRKGTFVIKAGDELEVLSHNDLSDKFQFNASPVVSENRLYLRSDNTLYCIGNQQRR